MITNGTLCSDIRYQITSADECRLASDVLGFRWGGSWNGDDESPSCSLATNANKVYFNLSPNPRSTNLPEESAQICRRANGTFFELKITIKHSNILNNNGGEFVCLSDILLHISLVLYRLFRYFFVTIGLKREHGE